MCMYIQYIHTYMHTVHTYIHTYSPYSGYVVGNNKMYGENSVYCRVGLPAVGLCDLTCSAVRASKRRKGTMTSDPNTQTDI